MMGYLYGKGFGSKIFSSQTFYRINTPTFLKPSSFFSKMRGISWLAAEPVSFARRTLLPGVSKFILHTYLPMKMEQSVPKRRHIKFRRRGLTQKKAYNKGHFTDDFQLLWTHSLDHSSDATFNYFVTRNVMPSQVHAPLGNYIVLQPPPFLFSLLRKYPIAVTELVLLFPVHQHEAVLNILHISTDVFSRSVVESYLPSVLPWSRLKWFTPLHQGLID
jgi:hypothetical protein